MKCFLLLAAFIISTAWADTRLPELARRQIGVTVEYDSAYVRLAYPGGDVPAERGVCTDA